MTADDNPARGALTVALTRAELEDLSGRIVDTALKRHQELSGDVVGSVLKRHREESEAHQLTADASASIQDDLTNRLKRAKVWAAAAVSVTIATSSVASVIYARGQADAARETKELQQDARISNTAASFAAHRLQAAKVASEQAEKIRHMGALQIEQGADQRAILLDIAPKGVAVKYRAKPDALKDAEATVRRD